MLCSLQHCKIFHSVVKKSPSKQLINTQFRLSFSGQKWFMNGDMAILPWRSPLNHLGAEVNGDSQGHDGFPSNSFWTVYRPKKHRPFFITWAAMWPYTTTNAGWSAVPTINRTALHSAHNTIQNVFWWFRQPVWPRTVKIHVSYHLLKWWR